LSQGPRYVHAFDPVYRVPRDKNEIISGSAIARYLSKAFLHKAPGSVAADTVADLLTGKKAGTVKVKTVDTTKYDNVFIAGRFSLLIKTVKIGFFPEHIGS